MRHRQRLGERHRQRPDRAARSDRGRHHRPRPRLRTWRRCSTARSASNRRRAAAREQGIIYYKNNSGLAIQFAAAGGILYRKALAEGIEQGHSDRMAGQRLVRLLQGRISAVAVRELPMNSTVSAMLSGPLQLLAAVVPGGHGGAGARPGCRRASTAASRSRSSSATAPAAATTSMRACSDVSWARTFPAIRPSCRRTCRAPAAAAPRTGCYKVAPQDGTVIATWARPRRPTRRSASRACSSTRASSTGSAISAW